MPARRAGSRCASCATTSPTARAGSSRATRSSTSTAGSAACSDRWLQDYLPAPAPPPGPEDLLSGSGSRCRSSSCWRSASGRCSATSRARASAASARRDGRPNGSAAPRRLGGPLTLLWAVAAIDLAVPRLALYPPAERVHRARCVAAGSTSRSSGSSRGCIDVAAARTLDRPANQDEPGGALARPARRQAVKIALVAVAASRPSPRSATRSRASSPASASAASPSRSPRRRPWRTSSARSPSASTSRSASATSSPSTAVTGTVESIGLRSTRIRTLDRTRGDAPQRQARRHAHRVVPAPRPHQARRHARARRRRQVRRDHRRRRRRAGKPSARAQDVRGERLGRSRRSRRPRSTSRSSPGSRPPTTTSSCSSGRRCSSASSRSSPPPARSSRDHPCFQAEFRRAALRRVGLLPGFERLGARGNEPPRT